MHAASFDALVLSHEAIGATIRRLTVRQPAHAPQPAAGQFYMLRAWLASEAPILSRPISLHSYNAQEQAITFLYEVRGIGTEKLARLQSGDSLSLTGPVGNGFPVRALTGKVALVGGGIGTAPLLALAQMLSQNGTVADFFAGYRDVPYCTESFAAVCGQVQIATDSGAAGHHGFVTDLLPPAVLSQYSAVCVCGPEPMMQRVYAMCKEASITCYVSKEAKMACGVGACLGCTCMGSASTPLSVCKDGPVFEGGVVYG